MKLAWSWLKNLAVLADFWEYFNHISVISLRLMIVVFESWTIETLMNLNLEFHIIELVFPV